MPLRGSLPLYSRGRFRAEVIEHAAGAGDLGKYSVGYLFEYRPVDLGDGGGHGVDGVDGADYDRPVEAPFAVADARRFHVGHHCEILPHLFRKSRRRELLADDGVGLAEGLEAVSRDGAEAADAQSRSREGLTVDHLGGKTESAADLADFVLKQKLNGLAKLEFEIFRQAADVVVALDGAAFDDVGVNRPLREEFDAAEFAGLLLEDADELGAYYLALLLGVGDSRQLVKEAVGGVDVFEICAEAVSEDLHDLLALAFSHKSVVDVDALEVFAYRLDEKGGDDGGVDSSREGEKDFFVADLRLDLGRLRGDKGVGKRAVVYALHGFGAGVG